ncbi:MAG: class I SAM-dependent methyltransferase [Planctomycetota bacterium]
MNGTPEFNTDIPCYLCGDRSYHLLHRKDPFKVVKCKNCSFVYVTPRLASNSIIDLYGSAYWNSDRAMDYGYTDYLADSHLYLNTFKLRSLVIESYKQKPGKVLDVGCAAGFFLKVMQDKGWEAHGIEVSETVAEHGRTQLGLENLRTGSINTLEEMPRDYFDVITFWDVIEHLEDPGAALKAAYPLLKEDGVLIVETQNVESAYAYLLGSSWQHYKHEEHLYHFSPITLRMLLSRAGFHILENSPRYGGKQVTINFIIERVGKIHPFLPVLLSPLKVIGNWNLYLNFLDEMIAVARKSGNA